MNRGVILGLLAATIGALALRLPQLDLRPMHADEAVNAVKFRALWEGGDYRYDPQEFHGPMLGYLTLALGKLTGAKNFLQFNEGRFRALTVCFGVGLVGLLLLMADGLGRAGTVSAAMLTALSPAMVFYSRDYIHEMLLVCFTFLALAGGWRYWRSRKIGWALLGGGAVGLMQSTKETFLLPLVAAALALAVNGLWARREMRAAPAGGAATRRLVPLRHIAAAVAAWLLVAALFFTACLRHPEGLLDAVKTYSPWMQRAAGDSPHVHAWNFYLERLTFYHVGGGPFWSEGLILGLAIVGCIAAFTGKGAPGAGAGLLRFLALYTMLLAAIYSVIPYKTPWCLLGFWHGAILLAGVGAAALMHRLRHGWRRWAVGILMLGGAAQLGVQAWRAGVTYCADRRNPYVYAQTSPDVLELAGKLESLARADAEGHHLLVQVIAPGDDYWPLPWYLRAFNRVGWWNEIPADPPAPVMIVAVPFRVALEEAEGHRMVGLFELRPGVFFELHVQTNLWRASFGGGGEPGGGAP